MSGMRRWMTALALLGLGLGASLGWQRWQGPQAAAPLPQVQAQAPHPAASAQAQAAQPSPSAAKGALPGSPLLAGPPPDGLSPRARRMREDWCGYGAREAAKDEALSRSLDSAASEGLDSMRALRAAQREQRAHWVRRLTERGDPRSLAIAAFLDEAFRSLPPVDPGSRARLQDLARRSTDPMLTSLALQRACPAGQCINVETTQWSRLEPDNAQAWLAQWNDETLPPHRKLELITQIASQARRADPYSAELVRVLRSLPAATEPGLAHQAETLLLAEFRTDPGAGLMNMGTFCIRGGEAPEQKRSCLAIADLLWRQDDLYLRWLASAMGQTLQGGSGPWGERSLLQDAVQHAWRDSQRQGQQALQALESRLMSSLCPNLAALRRWADQRLIGNEWQQGLDIVQGSGLDTRTWLNRWYEAHPDESHPQYLNLSPAASP